MDVDLAPDPAVGADRPRHLLRRLDRRGAELLARDELEDRARRADPDALAAPGAAGVIRVAVAPDDDVGLAPAVADVEDAHLLDVLARPHAPGAEDAVRHVVLD